VAAGTGRFVASGAGANSDLTIQGSTVQLGGGGTLTAEGAVNLIAAENRSTVKSTNKSSSGSVGIGYTAGSGVGVTVSASVAKGKANGSDLTYSNTRIESGGELAIQSGGDVTLKGAVITADAVTGTIGGNLTIESLQDKSTYDSEQTSAGFSYTYGAGGLSVSFSKTTLDSDYVSVKEQSAIRAGDGGFQLNVLGNTELKGGAFTSTQAAVEAGKNAFSTGSLTLSDVENYAEYTANSVGFSSGGSAGFGQDGANERSVTRAGISGYAGDLTVRTGDAESGIPRIFDLQKVEREIAAQVAITRAFGQVAPKAVADFADGVTQRHTNAKLDKERIEAALANETDPVRRAELEQARDQVNQIVMQTQGDYDKWREGGVYRAALHAALGGLSGGYAGAIGAGVVSTAAPLLDTLQDSLQAKLSDAGLKDRC
jgi:filamentous hemagglutinin